ncbi:HK97 gp10 family phage protein [Aneurinibacillus thermoaerophilus]|uniref:Bacteriophage HK97-gp10, putative tail-component n=1 Tax=Aneurinibacillus thermoaerophilus TaxID=143495 RepID=A0A1G8ENE6_ANETH|nr:HK97 gp10 family phage protein [Aneurinibacillus thermoaerophilus]MED0758665.1 HK97 gp10 family phage protein [Aneurinibacillus thermoaerophilus]MED0761055.1 HK97 gp10 family phage protein [Aneurinibacillus thermoaerophilus]SDH71413.1 Bacteriophage HK97-gp10, putative tail-component [Aneurinibacillus thermoaerophilus]
MGFELEGLDIFERMLLQRVIREMPDKVERKLTELAYRYLADVKRLTPVAENTPTRKGGTLRDSIRVDGVKRVGDEFVVVIGSNVHYAPHIEYGHRIKNKAGEYVGFVQGFHMFEIPLKQMEEWIDQDIKQWLQDIVEGRV